MNSEPIAAQCPVYGTISRLRPEVVAFAEAMEKKLRENDYKEHWRYLGMQTLSMRLTQEREELRRAVKRGDPDEVLREAADVANFAMMIADMVRRYPKTPNAKLSGRGTENEN